MAKQIPLPKKYSIPKSWKWIEIGSLAMMRSGYPFDSNKFSNDHEGRKPLIRIRDVVRGETTTFTNEHCPDEYTIHYGDVLIGMDGDFNVAKWKSEDALLNQRVCYICSTSKLLLNDYLYYYLPDPLKKINDATPSVTVKHLSTKTLAKTSIPLPPLPEQQRIVDRIESLFEKLDEAKEKAQAVVDGFEDRKAAILHKAFTGELTEQWRKKNCKEDQAWNKKRINQISIPRAGYAFDSKMFTERGYQIIRMGNLYGGKLDLTRNPVYLDPKDIDPKMLSRSLIKEGDILITLTGTKYKRDYGYAVCIRGQSKLLVNQRILCLSPNSEIVTNYLLYYLQSNLFRNVFFSKETGGVNQGNVSSRFVENIEIPMPTKKEQLVIVEKLDEIISGEMAVCDIARNTIVQIDTMKKSILARAFRGELGTNDPSDESAEELLKRIL